MFNTIRHSRSGKVKPGLIFIVSFCILLVLTIVGIGYLQGKAGNVESYVESVERAQQGMTLWQTLQSGGWVMVLLVLLSILMVSLILYLTFRLQPNQLVPADFSHDAIRNLREKKIGLVRQLCLDNDNLMSSVILAGLDKMDRGVSAARESIEITARREISSIWQGIGYLSDIAAVAPMVGLLGTVIGMIQAFNTIAFQAAVVKPILLAGGVSKAMVTTAGGMIIAIIAMIFFSLFRSKAQEITNATETYTTDILDALSENSVSNKG